MKVGRFITVLIKTVALGRFQTFQERRKTIWYFRHYYYYYYYSF